MASRQKDKNKAGKDAVSRRPLLNPEDSALWKNYAAGVAKLGKKKPVHAPPQPAPRIVVSVPAVPALLIARKDRESTLRAIDACELRKINKGKRRAESRLDLHGMRQEEAHRAAIRFIKKAHADGLRTVQIITGKGARKMNEQTNEQSERQTGGGILRERLPGWLSSSSETAALISGISLEKTPQGSDAGSYFITLKRG